MAKREKREERDRIIITKEEVEEIIKNAIRSLYSEYLIGRLDRIEDDDIKDVKIKRMIRARVKREKIIERIEEEGYGSLEELERTLIEIEKVDIFFKAFNILAGRDNKPMEGASITALVNTGKFTDDKANERMKGSLEAVYEVRTVFYNMASRWPTWRIR